MGRLPRAMASGVLAFGLVAAAVAGIWWGGRARADGERVVDQQSQALATSVANVLRRNIDAATGALRVMALSPDVFNEWAVETQQSGRYPGLKLFGYLRVVRGGHLGTALEDIAGDSATLDAHHAGKPGSLGDSLARSTAQPSDQVEYCVPTVLAGDPIFIEGWIAEVTRMTRAPSALECSELDFAGVPQARANGRLTVAAPVANSMIILQPQYQGGHTPATRGARERAFIGVMGAVVDTEELLEAALGDQRNVALELRRTEASGTTVVVGARGTPRDRPDRTIQFDADGSWQLAVHTDAAVGMPPHRQALVVAVSGGVIALLLFGLLTTLMRSRDRALRLVEKRTSELRHLALHDGLTGLANRTLIIDRAEQLLERARRNGTRGTALFIDLDGFKRVNDTFGHDAGDDLLRAVAERLRATLRSCDTIGRLGGDEFVVLVENDELDDGLETVAARILDTLRSPVPSRIAGMDLTVSGSVGVAVSDGTGTASDLLRDADLALYEAKSAGRDRFVVFRPDMHLAVHDRVLLGIELREALDRDQLYLEYQPTFDIASRRVTGMEALVRWDHPTRGTVPPATFIPIAEENGMIVELGAWVLRQACAQMARWQAGGHSLRINVNVSAHQLERSDFVGSVRDVLSTTGLAPAFLALEITESAVVTDAHHAVLRGLRALGVHVAIDDFGTGFSSLSYLRDLPVDCIKVDRSFLTDLETSPDARALLRALVELGQALGLETHAEGIENELQLAYLDRTRCDSGQGYFFARPMRAEQAGRFLDGALPVEARQVTLATT